MWSDLEEAEKKIKTLEEQALIETMPTSAYGRELSTFLVQELECSANSLEERRVTFYNGDGETFYLCNLSVSVFLKTPFYPSVSRVILTYTPRGWNTPSFAGGSLNSPFFDFSWNYAVNSRQSLYSRDYLSSSIIASGTDRAQMFSFDKPLRLVPSDSVELRVLPTLLPIPSLLANPQETEGATFIVSFVFLGYRSGE
jgi:hypothetical protein